MTRELLQSDSHGCGARVFCSKEKYAQPSKTPLYHRAAQSIKFEIPHFITGRQTDPLAPRTHGTF